MSAFLHDHLLKLHGLTPESTVPAYWNDKDGTRHEFDAPAVPCFDSWNGYWHNFRLADYVWKTFPRAVSCGFINTKAKTA